MGSFHPFELHVQWSEYGLINNKKVGIQFFCLKDTEKGARLGKQSQRQPPLIQGKQGRMSRKCFYIKPICMVFTFTQCFFHQLTSESQVSFHWFDKWDIETTNPVSCQEGYTLSTTLGTLLFGKYNKHLQKAAVCSHSWNPFCYEPCFWSYPFWPAHSTACNTHSFSPLITFLPRKTFA